MSSMSGIQQSQRCFHTPVTWTWCLTGYKAGLPISAINPEASQDCSVVETRKTSSTTPQKNKDIYYLCPISGVKNIYPPQKMKNSSIYIQHMSDTGHRKEQDLHLFSLQSNVIKYNSTAIKCTCSGAKLRFEFRLCHC